MIRNSSGILQFLASSEAQLHRQHYAYGAVRPVLSGLSMLPPFQFVVDGEATISGFELLDLSTETATNILTSAQAVGLTSTYIAANGPYTVLSFPGVAPITGIGGGAGDYYLRLTTGGATYESEVFRMCEDLSKYAKVTWCHANDIFLSFGRIIYSGALAAFKMFLYVPTTIGKPQYEYENQVENRDGKSFFVRQIRYKRFRFEAILPEHILDGFSLAPLHDFITIEHNGQTYDVDEIEIEVAWQEQGDLAVCTIEFRTDTIVIVNGRGITDGEGCTVEPGGCFDIEWFCQAYLVEGSTDYNNFQYTRESDGQTVALETGDYVLVENSGNGQVTVELFNGSGYTSTFNVAGFYAYDQNTGQYYYFDGGYITNEITDVAIAGPTILGNAVPPGALTFYGQQGDGSEILLGIEDPLLFNGQGFAFDPPLCLKAVRMEAANGVCGSYYSGDWFQVGPFDLHNVPIDAQNQADAQSQGVLPGGLFATTIDNTLGLPEGIIVQVPPYDNGGYISIDAGETATGGGCMFALADNNIHGLPGGTLSIGSGVTIYDNDAAAASGGILQFRIYAFNGLPLGFPSPIIKKRLT
jgi:hypothetical protein